MVAPWSSCQVINNGEACCLEPFFGWCFGFRSLQLDGVFLFISMYRLVTSVLDLSKKASVLDFFLSNKRKCYAFLFCFRWRHEVFTTFKIISAVWCSFDVNWKMIMRKTMYYLIMIVDAMMGINLLVNVFFFFFFLLIGISLSMLPLALSWLWISVSTFIQDVANLSIWNRPIHGSN